MSSYLNVLLFSGHQVMDTFIKLILIICFKLQAGMVAVLQMLKGLQSLSNVYNMSGRVVSDIQTRAESEVCISDTTRPRIL